MSLTDWELWAAAQKVASAHDGRVAALEHDFRSNC
jgi:hypothetical protein